MSEMYPSPWLKTGDVSGVGQNFTMKGVNMEEFKDPTTQEKEVKPVLYFVETDKGLVLNKTNARAVVKMFGDDTDAWAGKRVKLHLEEVESFGKTVDGIRIVEAEKIGVKGKRK
jgi:hypothetical protein